MSEYEFYSCNDNAERLTCTTVSEAVEYDVDQWEQPPAIDDLITVYAYRRMPLPSRNVIADTVVTHVVEWLDEEYLDPEGVSGDNVDIDELTEAALCFAEAVHEHYRSDACEVAESWKERVADHVPEQWLDATEDRTNDT